MHQPRRAACTLACTLVALCSAATAQSVPDAGQLQRELLLRPDRPVPAAPSLGVREPAGTPAEIGGARFAVQSVLIQGHTAFTTDALQALVADLPGPARTLADAQAAAQRITAHYRAHGYPVARAYVPAQDVTAGLLRIEVLEGRLDSVDLANGSRVGDALLSAALHGLRPGAVITSAPIDRALLLWSETPGVGAVQGTLRPGEQVGTSRLGFELEPSPFAQGSVALDNHGSAFTGRARVGGLLQLDSPLGLGDQLSLSALTSGRGLQHGRLAYEWPLGAAGSRLGLARHQTRYRLGGDFADLQASGAADSTRLFVGHPIWLAPTSRLSATLHLERQALHDRIGITGSATDKVLHTLSLSLDGSWRDLAGERASSFHLQLANGRLRIDSWAAAAQDAASAKAQGCFTRMEWALNHLRRVGPDSQVAVSYAGQRANRNLDSAEKFAIGGPRAVRAYASAETSGDDADLLGLEWRQALGHALQGLAFYDVGRVRLNHSPFDAGADRHRTLSGAGIGLNADMNLAGSALSLQSSLAWPLRGGPARGAPVNRPALWLTLASRF